MILAPLLYAIAALLMAFGLTGLVRTLIYDWYRRISPGEAQAQTAFACAVFALGIAALVFALRL